MYLGIEKGCHFGGCKNYIECEIRRGAEPIDYTECKNFRECFTYMDKYGNDMGNWVDMHGCD